MQLEAALHKICISISVASVKRLVGVLVQDMTSPGGPPNHSLRNRKLVEEVLSALRCALPCPWDDLES